MNDHVHLWSDLSLFFSRSPIHKASCCENEANLLLVRVLEIFTSREASLTWGKM